MKQTHREEEKRKKPSFTFFPLELQVPLPYHPPLFTVSTWEYESLPPFSLNCWYSLSPIPSPYVWMHDLHFKNEIFKANRLFFSLNADRTIHYKNKNTLFALGLIMKELHPHKIFNMYLYIILYTSSNHYFIWSLHENQCRINEMSISSKKGLCYKTSITNQ